MFDSKENILTAVVKELACAREKFKSFNSAHEGYALLLEEVEELWDEVKKKPQMRDKNLMRSEAIQVAAMAMRFVMDVCE